MKFDFTINLGNVLSVVSFIFVMYSLHSANAKRISAWEFKVELLYDWFCKHIINKSKDQ